MVLSQSDAKPKWAIYGSEVWWDGFRLLGMSLIQVCLPVRYLLQDYCYKIQSTTQRRFQRDKIFSPPIKWMAYYLGSNNWLPSLIHKDSGFIFHGDSKKIRCWPIIVRLVGKTTGSEFCLLTTYYKTKKLPSKPRSFTGFCAIFIQQKLSICIFRNAHLLLLASSR